MKNLFSFSSALLLVVMLFFLWVALLFCLIFEGQINLKIQKEISAIQDDKMEIKDKEITILFVGDIMLDRGVSHQIKKHQDFHYPFLKTAEKISSADIAFGNLEGPISSSGKNQGSIYSFRAAPETIQGLVFAGFDILSLANNHILDWGPEALKDTIILLKENGIDSVGAGINYEEANKPVIKEIKGAKIAFLAYIDFLSPVFEARLSGGHKENWPGLSEFNLNKIKGRIKKTKEEADIVIVSMHWGEEYKSRSNKNQQNLAYQLIDAGADLIVGHHPHVVQEIEYYKDKPIFYSLGNFVFDQGFSEETMTGLAIEAKIKDKKIIGIRSIEVKISPTFQPEFSDL